jgi:GxxExxY protein
MIAHHGGDFNRGGAETRRKLIHEELSEQVIGAAIEVHRVLGPGLLESAYEECLCRELNLRGVRFARQVELPIEYKRTKLDCGYRMDIVVNDQIVLEIKCVNRIHKVHEAQLITCLRLSGRQVGFIFNFHADVLTRGGMVRKVLESPSSPQRLRASAARNNV